MGLEGHKGLESINSGLDQSFKPGSSVGETFAVKDTINVEKLEYIDNQISDNLSELGYTDKEQQDIFLELLNIKDDQILEKKLDDINNAFDRSDIDFIFKKLKSDQEKSAREQKVSKDNQDISKDNQEKSAREQKVSKDNQEKSVREQKVSKDNQEKSVREQDIEIDILDIKKKKEKLKELQKIIKEIGLSSSNPNYGFVVEFLDKVEKNKDFDEDEFDKFINRLKTSPKILSQMVFDIKRKSPEKYSDFEKSLISIDSDFKSHLDAINRVGFYEAEQVVKIGTTDFSGVQLDGENLVKKDSEITVIASDDIRKISLNDSEYNLDSNLNIKSKITEIENENKRLIEFLLPINEKISELERVISFLDKNISKDSGKVKEYLKNNFSDIYYDYNLDFTNDLQDIKNKIATDLVKQRDLKEQEIKKSIFFVKSIVEENALSAEKKDEKQRKMLRFLHKINLDLIPQGVIDEIFEQINKSEGLKAKFGFTNNIDLANGSLGINKDYNENSMSFAEQKAFVEFVNIMISSDPHIPNYITSTGEMQFFESKDDLESGKVSEFTDKASYINQRLGINPLLKIRENLGV